MTTLKLTTGEWLGVTVPEGAFDISIKKTTLEGFKKTGGTFFYRDLPEGSYSLPFPCVVVEMTEEQARKVVEKIHVEESPSPGNDWAGGWHYAYVDYEEPPLSEDDFAGWNGNCGCCRTAKSSLLSLCRANGLNPSTTILLKVN